MSQRAPNCGVSSQKSAKIEYDLSSKNIFIPISQKNIYTEYGYGTETDVNYLRIRTKIRLMKN